MHRLFIIVQSKKKKIIMKNIKNKNKKFIPFKEFIRLYSKSVPKSKKPLNQKPRIVLSSTDWWIKKVQKSSAFTIPGFNYTGVIWDPIGKPVFDLLTRGLISGKLKIRVEIRDKNFLNNSKLSIKICTIHHQYRTYQADSLDILWNILIKKIYSKILETDLYIKEPCIFLSIQGLTIEFKNILPKDMDTNVSLLQYVPCTLYPGPSLKRIVWAHSWFIAIQAPHYPDDVIVFKSRKFFNDTYTYIGLPINYNPLDCWCLSDGLYYRCLNISSLSYENLKGYQFKSKWLLLMQELESNRAVSMNSYLFNNYTKKYIKGDWDLCFHKHIIPTDIHAFWYEFDKYDTRGLIIKEYAGPNGPRFLRRCNHFEFIDRFDGNNLVRTCLKTGDTFHYYNGELKFTSNSLDFIYKKEK